MGTKRHKRLPTAPCVCVFTAVCVHLGWVKCRARILSMGHFHTCMSFFLLNTKEAILKNASNQIVDGRV